MLRSLAPPFGAPASLAATPGRIIIITDTLYTSTPTSAFLQSFLACCRSNGIALLHVVLSCDSSTNISRLASSHRADRDIDEDGLVGLRMEEEVGHYFTTQDRARGSSVDGLSGELEVDSSTLTARATAGMVRDWSMDALRKHGWVFPAARK